MKQEIVVYETQDGKLPFWEWLRGLKDRKGRAVIQARIERVRLGNFGNCRSVGSGVQELKIYFGPGYRVYFGRDGINIVILLCGGDKSDQKEDIVFAKELWKEYKNAS
ncbi:MAG: type II toxin-antitoxin system RelE/ParE family toxin [Cyanobacteria bacterium P01_F01_bin.143]